MIISREYTVSPKTSLLNKDQDEINLGKGTITKITIQSAPGVNGEIYIRVMHFENSILPDETGEWICLYGGVQPYSMNFNDWSKVHVITIEICAPDARFQHKINVEIELEESLTLQQLFISFIKGGLKSQSL